MTQISLQNFLKHVKARDPYQSEFLQATQEVFSTIWPFLEQRPQYREYALLERLVEPERVIQFRVSWVDDHGQTQVNRAYRIQHNSALGPYKGGIRFHPSVNLSVLKFLAFEQTFKNALTALPLGSAKGGSDFDPKQKSELEIMRFCQALMSELYLHLGEHTDVPAGDIGVGSREIGYMTGMMKKLTNSNAAVFTGKGLAFGGSQMRTEATGYGLIYFVEQMLKTKDDELNGKKILISGSGNVAQYAAEKAIDLNAKVISLSDSNGTLYVKDGISKELLEEIMQLKNQKRGRLSELSYKGAKFLKDQKPWHLPADIALPCATQNELDHEDAKLLIKNGIGCVAEGANMPITIKAIEAFMKAKILYAPSKASNAGGVATSGLEMSQNAMRLAWSHAQVDERLHEIMKDIHSNCVRYGKNKDGSIDYLKGANIAGFVKVADAMLGQGIT